MLPAGFTPFCSAATKNDAHGPERYEFNLSIGMHLLVSTGALEDTNISAEGGGAAVCCLRGWRCWGCDSWLLKGLAGSPDNPARVLCKAQLLVAGL